MPRKTARNKLPLKERERLFVDRYIEKGANESAIPEAEHLASLDPGHGQKLLRRATVQLEIYKKTEPLRLAKLHQDTISQTVDLAAQKMKADIAARIAVIRALKIEHEIVDGVLMEIILSPPTEILTPDTLLKAITMAKVDLGRWETPHVRLALPPERPQGEVGIYQAIWSRIPSNPAPWPSIAPPEASQTTIEAPKQLPQPGESIEEVPETPKKDAVMTVHVGV